MTDISSEQFQETVDTQHGRFLTFSVGEESYGIEIRCITEIVGIQPISKLPDMPEYIKGIINLRGKIIPVIDMRLKFKKEAADYTDRTCIIVMDAAGFTVGLIVDNVAEVMTIDDDNIVPPPDIRSGLQSRYVSGIGKVGSEVKLLLDCEELFREEDIMQISNSEGDKKG